MPAPDASAPRAGRVVIEHVTPEIDCGRFPAKREQGDVVTIEADIFADGHDEISAILLYRHEDDSDWQQTPMQLLGNDHWRGGFTVEKLGAYLFKLEAWVNGFATWQRDLRKWIEAGVDVSAELRVGAIMLWAAATAAPPEDGEHLKQRMEALDRGDWVSDARTLGALDEVCSELMLRYAPREPLTTYDRDLRVAVDSERARFSAWYELFPRSTSPDPRRHGNFQTVIDRLPYIAELGFDILYLPPIHPIGEVNRKGKNNAETPGTYDAGSPWAIGSKHGGHTALHPDLGSLKDFQELIKEAKGLGIELALDIAYQCAPDHPWVKQHPQWFRHRPDGSIRYAENPPKQYQDIYPIDFETEDWRALWQGLEGVVRYWCEQGVRVFRVDNPHTKSFAFWEWMIAAIKADYPEAIFLSEAFTRPRTMYYLSKLGFTQSYTYFTWRNNKYELMEYLTELTQSEVREYFRPNFWPNTPDILHEFLQQGGRPAFISRFVLAATLTASYGIYGPVFELGVNTPREHGSEEYLDSEKYEVKHWDLDSPTSLRDLIAHVNKARRENPALQRNDTLRFLQIDNDNMIAYTKTSLDGENVILVVVSLDSRGGQSGWLHIPLEELGFASGATYAVDDLLRDTQEQWRGDRMIFNLHPSDVQARVLRLHRLPESQTTALRDH